VLGQLYLEEPLAGASVLGKDIEDESRAVQDLDIEGLLQVALLGGGEFVIEYHGGKPQFVAPRGDLHDLAAADVSRRVRAVQPLHCAANDLGASGPRQEGQLFQGSLGAPAGGPSVGLSHLRCHQEGALFRFRSRV